jgi:PadR family transcriptional regulator PadR
MTSDPLAWWWGVKLSGELDLRSGTIYPLLARLEKAGWLESKWEEIDPAEQGRPRRRLYRLTGEGEVVAARALAEIGAPSQAVQGEGRDPALKPRLGWA